LAREPRAQPPHPGRRPLASCPCAARCARLLTAAAATSSTAQRSHDQPARRGGFWRGERRRVLPVHTPDSGTPPLPVAAGAAYKGRRPAGAVRALRGGVGSSRWRAHMLRWLQAARQLGGLAAALPRAAGPLEALRAACGPAALSAAAAHAVLWAEGCGRGATTLPLGAARGFAAAAGGGRASNTGVYGEKTASGRPKPDVRTR
jgi:hypothetical protein